jgi:DNA modification methylase
MPNALAPALSIVRLPIDAIRPDPQNPRVHTPKQIQQIATSITRFRFNVPILVDRDGCVVAGHGRLAACRLLGMTEIPVIRLEHLTPAQARAFLIADNRLSELATWDDKLLAENLQALAAVDLDFALEDTGFEMAEIDLRIASLGETPTDDADEVEPPAPDAIAVTVLGDDWQLGPHRLRCGNALIAAEYTAVLVGAKADIVFTDSPYNVPIAGHVSGHGKLTHRSFAMAVGELSVAEFTDFLLQVAMHCRDASTEGSLHFYCMDWRHLPELLAAGNAVYTEFKNLCVWVKDNAGMGSLYRSQHELVLLFKHGTAAHINNVELGRHGRSRSNVWHYAGSNSFARATDEGNLLALHPTVKPVAMIADALYDCSRRGDLVLDPFMGSGSTMIAAERTGRRCAGIELDPLYVDVAIRRWQRATGKNAVHVASGESFAVRERAVRDSVARGTETPVLADATGAGDSAEVHHATA